MAIVAEFSVPTTSFPFGAIFDVAPGARIELERVIPVEGMLVPYVWIRVGGIDGLDDVLEEADGVRSSTVVDTVGNEHLLRVEWDPDDGGILWAVTEADVVLLSAVGTAEEWTLRVRGESGDRVAAFQSRCGDAGVPITLQSLHPLEAIAFGETYGLTDPQREALVLAHRRGYFDHPRETTLAEVADELGISRQALASRLRRGYRRLVENAILSE